jgi:hypothetical protein
VFPGIGDWYLGHHTLAAVEIATASIGWMVVVWQLLYNMAPASEMLLACAGFFALVHGTDAFATRQIARMGHYPDIEEKPTIGASLMRFATVIGVFILAIAAAIASDIMSGEAEENRTAIREESEQAENPAIQQARAAQAARVEQVDVATIAERIATRTSDLSVVVLYAIRTEQTQMIFPHLVALQHEFAARDVDFKLFSVDYDEHVADLPPFLAKHQAGFAPIRVRRWPTGELSKAMMPLGISVGATWEIPLVAVLDREGNVLWQAQGVTDLQQLETVLTTER